MEFNNDIKYLDQHFLVGNGAINSFIDAANLKITDNVVEIGPGKCEISEIIARKVNHLTCIEIDRKLEHFISVLMDKYENVEVIYGNALNVFIPECNKIISALPYSITEPFIEKLLKCTFDEAILIVGKNYADNVINKSLNKLSLLTNSFFTAEKICDLTPDAFEPSPRVMSSIIKIKPLKREELINNHRLFIIREMFFRRDRKLKNNLVESLITYEKTMGRKLTKKESKAIVEKFNLDKETLDKQMENLSNEEFELIYNVLEWGKMKKKSIMLICSQSNYDKVKDVKTNLELKGYNIITPNGYGEENYSNKDKEMSEKEYKDFFKSMFNESREKISEIDAVLVLNYDKVKNDNIHKNYIGASTFLEMYEAFMQNKKIFLIKELVDSMLYDEIKGFDPIVINENLDNINL